MDKPPQRIDGATVRKWTVATSGRPFGYVLRGRKDRAIVGLALATYDDGGVYLFACDAKWRVLGDTLWGSLAEAEIAASQWYDNVPEGSWAPVDNSR